MSQSTKVVRNPCLTSISPRLLATMLFPAPTFPEATDRIVGIDVLVGWSSDSRVWLANARKGNVQKGALSKAAGALARGAYVKYVSTTKGRERR